MYDLFTVEEDKEAAASGWSLNYVYNMKTQRWATQILPLAFIEPFKSAEAVATHVVGLARMGHALSIKALRLVAAPVTREKK